MIKRTLGMAVAILSLNAIPAAHDLSKELVAKALVEIAQSGECSYSDYSSWISAESKTSLDELAACLTDNQEADIWSEWAAYTLDTRNYSEVMAFIVQAKDLFVELDDADDYYDLLKIYNRLLPIVAQHRNAALIMVKTFVFNDDILREPLSSHKAYYAIMCDALMQNEDGSLITAALAASSGPAGGSHAMAKFAQTV